MMMLNSEKTTHHPDHSVLKLIFEDNCVYAIENEKKMKAVVSGLKPCHFGLIRCSKRQRIEDYVEIADIVTVVPSSEDDDDDDDDQIILSISELEAASRHKARNWECTLRGRVVSVGGRRMAKSASNSFILELTDEKNGSSVRVVFQGAIFMRYYSCLRYGDVVVISHLRRKQIRLKNEFECRVMAATPKRTRIHVVNSSSTAATTTTTISFNNNINTNETITITGYIGDIHGHGQFSILPNPTHNVFNGKTPFRVYVTGSTAVPFEGLGFREGTKIRLCHVHPIVHHDNKLTIHGFVFCEKSSIQLLELSASTTTTPTSSPVILPAHWRQITRTLPLVTVPWALTHMFPVLEMKFGRMFCSHTYQY